MKSIDSRSSYSFLIALLLTFTGGFLDAYTYWCRGGVFSNAQTGNVIFLAYHLFRLQFPDTLRYLIPICAFCAGVAVSELAGAFLSEAIINRYRLILLIEIAIIISVGFMPQAANIFASCLISFVSALQWHTFPKIGNNPYSSINCTSNLRNAVGTWVLYITKRNKDFLKKASFYLCIVGAFICAAGIGSLCSAVFNEKGIWWLLAPLAISFVLISKRQKGK